MEPLRNKTLVMIVGPSAIGKSSLMNEVVKQNDDFSYARSFTTRPRRNDETSSHYSFITRDEATMLRDSGQALTFFEHPTSGIIYGTALESFPKKYNLLDTLSATVSTYRKLPFSHTVTVSLTAPAEQWREWFLSRYPEQSDEALKRLKEARLSIEWSLSQTKGHHWLINHENKTSETAAKLIDIVRHDKPGDSGSDLAQEILSVIERGVWT